MKNKLILFTSDFPFGTGETFLETEIEYLCKGFDEVQIVSSSESIEQTRSVPENCDIDRIDLNVGAGQKLLSLFQVFNPLFWKELKVIRTVYQLPISMGIVFTMLVSLNRGKKVAQKVRSLSDKIGSNEQLFFYSYWCDDVALGLAIAQKKQSEIKTFCRIHGWDVYFERSSFGYLPFRHFISSSLSKIFSISQHGINYAEKVWKIDTGKFVLSRLGVSNNVELKYIERDHFVLISCSVLIPLKRVHLIAEALFSVKEFRIHWVHIGDGPELEKLRVVIGKFSKNISVELKGRMSNSAIYAFYDEIKPDLFVNVSSTEGLPVSIMEAMSFGIPVLATEVGGTSEIVNEKNGLLLKEDITSSDLSDTIISVLNEPEKLKLKGEKAHQKWKEEFNAETNFSALIDSLLDI